MSDTCISLQKNILHSCVLQKQCHLLGHSRFTHRSSRALILVRNITRCVRSSQQLLQRLMIQPEQAELKNLHTTLEKLQGFLDKRWSLQKQCKGLLQTWCNTWLSAASAGCLIIVLPCYDMMLSGDSCWKVLFKSKCFSHRTWMCRLLSCDPQAITQKMALKCKFWGQAGTTYATIRQ